jgi:hypothetical protein
MAATEVIHFPFTVQLDRGTTFPADAIRDSTASPPGSPPHLFDLLQARPDVTALSSAAGGLCMKLQLFQQIVEINHPLEEPSAGVAKLESIPFFQRDLIRHARSDVEIARVYANRKFFDNFEKIVEDDAKWAYRFQRDFDRKLKDRDDIYLEVRDSEQRRKRKELPPRVVILPNWDWSDQDRYDEKHSQQRKKSVLKRHRAARTKAMQSRSRVRGSTPTGTPRKGGRRP